MNKKLFLISLLVLSTQALSNENIDKTIDLDIEGVNIEEQIIFDQKQQDFVNSIKRKLEETKLELSIEMTAIIGILWKRDPLYLAIQDTLEKGKREMKFCYVKIFSLLPK